ncbi:MAG TPA: ABC transporter permease [Anaerolineales bacterium]|nr:ABC transporter permease [Anaerolineales bacterium]
MRIVWIIAVREYKRYFATPAAYAIALFLLLIVGFLFNASILAALQQSAFGGGGAPGVQVILSPLVFLLLFASPAITMHLLAEEQRMGTIELMLTAPVKDWELVVGKWLGAFLFMVTIVAITLVYPLILNNLVSPGIDQGRLVSGYLGVILFCSTITAIGVAISSFFSNQVAAFFVTLGVLLVLWIISAPSQATGGTPLLTYLDLRSHFYDTFYVGVIDIRDVVYHVSVTALFLFLGSTIVEMRRWS